jgi:hypothetical protein
MRSSKYFVRPRLCSSCAIGFNLFRTYLQRKRMGEMFPESFRFTVTRSEDMVSEILVICSVVMSQAQ